MTNPNQDGKGYTPVFTGNGYRPSDASSDGGTSPAQGGYTPVSSGDNPTNTNPPGDD